VIQSPHLYVISGDESKDSGAGAGAEILIVNDASKSDGESVTFVNQLSAS